MSERDNAERAERAEAAIIAYIRHTGDSLKANGIDTWVGDLLCDMRHFADRVGFEFNGDAGEMNYEAEKNEDPKGHFVSQVSWYVEGERRKKL